MVDSISQILEMERKKILDTCISMGILRKGEYEESFKGKYIDQFGCDSFVNYMSYLIPFLCDNKFKNSVFLTFNKKILKDRDKLQKRFKLKIKSLEEMKK
jgi:hypothetical protein